MAVFITLAPLVDGPVTWLDLATVWSEKRRIGSVAEMRVEAKGEEKALVAIEHRKLECESSIVDRKQAWAGLLNDCFAR